MSTNKFDSHVTALAAEHGIDLEWFASFYDYGASDPSGVGETPGEFARRSKFVLALLSLHRWQGGRVTTSEATAAKLANAAKAIQRGAEITMTIRDFMAFMLACGVKNPFAKLREAGFAVEDADAKVRP